MNPSSTTALAASLKTTEEKVKNQRAIMEITSTASAITSVNSSTSMSIESTER